MALQKIKLNEVFRLIREPRYIVGTTYTLSLAFFESVVLPSIDRSALRRCVIVADRFGFQRALDEATALENAGQNYVVTAPPTNRCLHAKVWLVASDSEALLLVGSGNLTQSGFVSNAELFDLLHFTAASPGSPSMLQSIRDFVDGLAALWQRGSDSLAAEALEEVSNAIAVLPVAKKRDDSEVRFLHSLKSSLVNQLPIGQGAKRVSIAAPFFGGGLGGIELFSRRYPEGKLRVFPAVHRDDSVDVPHQQIAIRFKGATTARLKIEPKPTAFQHLKLYAVEYQKQRPWLFCASANCTRAALEGDNIEAGILRPIQIAVLRDYFQASGKPLPTKVYDRPNDSKADVQLHIETIDNGHSLSISVANPPHGYLPVTDVTIAVKTGNAAATSRRALLFSSSDIAMIPWSEFTGWTKPRNRAIRIEIRGRTTAGRDVFASSFVQNRLLLTSDPIHRSAWRGALALLDIEAVPELADIAAVFSLARGVFDTSLSSDGALTGPTRAREAFRVNPGIAVWPPQPDLHELHRNLSKTTTGQLRWFQEIMRTLLSTPKREIQPATTGDTGADTENADENEQQRLERQERAITTAERLWDHATRDYNALCNKLFSLEPTADNAHKVWPVAVFTFLATMSVLQVSIRISPGVDWMGQISEVTDGFLRLMFTPRKQPDDYCCPKDARYRQETFPSLADDLAKTFSQRPDSELGAVVFAMVADRKMRSTPGMFKIMWQQRVRQIWATGFRCDDETRTVCRRIWERFLVGHSQSGDPADFDNAVDDLCTIAAELNL